MTKVRECKILLVQQVCDKCGDGVMKLDKILTDGIFSELTYRHKCDKCGHEETYSHHYPALAYIPIEPLREMTDEEKEKNIQWIVEQGRED